MQWSPDTLSTFVQCASLYDATIYTTVQCNELQILSDENFLHYKCCTVLLSSALQTVQRYVQHLLKLCCSAVQCCTLKNAPIRTELLFSDCPFQCSPLCVRRHLPVLNRWKVDLIEIAAEIQNRFRIGGNIWLRFPPCSYETPSAVRNTVALGYEGNTVV